jgi:hypothetical protein
MRVGNATVAVEAIPRPSWAACARTAHEYQGAGRPDLVGGATCDLEREQQVLGEAASRLLWRHFQWRPVVGSAGGDHHVVDRGWESLEERLQGGRIVGVEGRGVLRVELERCSLEAFRAAPGEDDAGALGAGSPGGFQPDAGAAADDDDGLAEQFRFALGGYSSGCGGHDSSGVVRATGHQVAAETALTLRARCGLRHRSK